MIFTPLFDNVLVKVIEEENKTTGGIIIPDSAKEKSFKGEVVGIGQGKNLENGSVQKITVNIGDIVCFAKYVGTDIKIDGQDYILLKENDILGTFNK